MSLFNQLVSIGPHFSRSSQGEQPGQSAASRGHPATAWALKDTFGCGKQASANWSQVKTGKPLAALHPEVVRQ